MEINERVLLLTGTINMA